MNSCPDPVELVRAEGLPRDHPLREHLRKCGRCRASLRALEAFRSAENRGDVPDAELSIADRRLEEFIATELLGEEPAPPAEPPRIRATPTWARGWLAAAAVAAVVVGVWLAGPRIGGEDSPTGNELRGDLVPAEGTLTNVAVTGDPGGGLLVRWEPVAGAEDYEIIVWTAALVELTRLEPQPETSRRLPPGTAADPAPAFLSVVARQGGREIARSELVNLP